MSELRRIAGGEFLAISHFFPEDDLTNAAALHQNDLDALAFERSTLAQFRAAGWQVEIANVYEGRALPTPTSDLLGIGIDGLPVAETTLKWCVLIAR